MIEIIQEYWRNYLYTDGYRLTGVVITLWLLVVSIGLGFCLSDYYFLIMATVLPE